MHGIISNVAPIFSVKFINSREYFSGLTGIQSVDFVKPRRCYLRSPSKLRRLGDWRRQLVKTVRRYTSPSNSTSDRGNANVRWGVRGPCAQARQASSTECVLSRQPIFFTRRRSRGEMGAGQGSAESVRGFAIGVGRGIALLLRWPGCLKRRRAMPCGISAAGLTWRANLSELGSRSFAQSASHGPRHCSLKSATTCSRTASPSISTPRCGRAQAFAVCSGSMPKMGPSRARLDRRGTLRVCRVRLHRVAAQARPEKSSRTRAKQTCLRRRVVRSKFAQRAMRRRAQFYAMDSACPRPATSS